MKFGAKRNPGPGFGIEKSYYTNLLQIKHPMLLPLRDENPHPPGFKPKVTIGLIILNVIVFFYEVAVTGQFWDFRNTAAALMFFEWARSPDASRAFPR